MYSLDLMPEARDDLAGLDKPVARRILNKLRWLAENLDAVTLEPLTGKWKGVFKLRIGDYRALYTVDRTERRITVHLIKHRREVYKTG
ncbi:MAG: type II toxin-antitoxin system RelE/ParE family toxin [Anaerolineae bacterium]|nr:type II toxin-antitoxin system RelE/ParE family toxin [Anaerolineae bacterium]